MKTDKRLERAIKKMPIYQSSIVSNYIRINSGNYPDYTRVHFKDIMGLTAISNTSNPNIIIEQFDEKYAITRDGMKIPYHDLVMVTFEENYRYDDLNLFLRFITKIKKGGFVRSIAYMVDGKDCEVYGNSTKNLFFMEDPFFKYETLIKLVRKLKANNIIYRLKFSPYLGVIIHVVHNYNIIKMRTLFYDRTHRLVVIDNMIDEVPMNATQAFNYIKRQK